MNFLFWNINKKPLADTIANLCKEHNIDILILAESAISQFDLLKELNRDKKNKKKYYANHPISQCTKITIYTSFSSNYITPIEEDHRTTYRKLEIPNKEPILLIGTHFVDKSSFSPASQLSRAFLFSRKTEEIEAKLELNKKILIGDLNMNPFEQPMVDAAAFNCTKSSIVAAEIERQVQYQKYKYFYNPMWSMYGDLTKRVAGTYFYSKAEDCTYKWNIFDQVLLRPQLINKFDKQSLEIITEFNGISLLKVNNTPNEIKYSDHLPIKFTLNI